MVIQANMPVNRIVEVWGITQEVFQRLKIQVDSRETLKELVHENELLHLIEELNHLVGSSGKTCTEGG
ncbi:hypothetical protein JJB07_02770 [Tumebacillus sp. ITR2]|uniref:Uncharacterized protein n=1 Tax=Tumebacillus amylolyticus TaxID=2801339 RepID=A0ABS1J5K2_9BACL|nr:hypothetical protein [Tumebacillus amylolyticus]MBL0385562.1 hypothetical protein [Tumebacillus amylolyticus]